MASLEMTLPPVKRFAPGRTHARMRKKLSASTSSTLDEEAFDMIPIVTQRISGYSFEACEQIKWYNLGKLTGSPEIATYGASDGACKKYLSTLFPEYTCEKKMVEVFQRTLPPLFCSTREFPDVCVYKQGEKIPLLQVETHSSHYANTIRKCTIGVIDQLRFHRMVNPNITNCIGFAFPKLPRSNTDLNYQSVVRVKVTWETKMMGFVYDLEPLQVQVVRTALEDALRINESQAPPKYQEDMHEMYVVRLSTRDLEVFGDKAIQVPSNSSILVETKEMYYKMPISPHTRTLYRYLWKQSEHAVRLDFEPELQVLVDIIKSPKQPHYPMDRDEARDCLCDLVRRVAIAISDLHRLGWAHQDIRLDNICFTNEYQPILIDLDRVRRVTVVPVAYLNTCMYKEGFDPCQIDWMQLGWVAAWAYCEGEGNTDYHSRTFEQLPCECKSDPLLEKLITKGMCIQ